MDWKEIYKIKGTVQEQPSKLVVDLIPLLKKEKVKRIFDHGCGTGRHIKFLAEEGFEIYGSDYSKEAIDICKGLVSSDYSKNLVVSNMDIIPFRDNYFDFILSSQVIQHALKQEREGAIAEIKRTLGIGKILLLRTVSHKQFGYGLGIEVEENTYLNIPNIPDSSTPHHYFSKKELEDYFRDFDILSLEHRINPPKNKFWDNGLNEFVLLARRKY